MMRPTTRAVLTMAVAVAACAPAMVTSDPATAEAAIRARSADMLRAVTARDANAIVAFHTPDAVLLAPNSAAAVGHDAIRTSWAGMLGMPNLNLRWAPTSVVVSSSGDLAVERGTYEMSFNTPGGPVNDRGNYTTTWRRVGDQWFVASDAVVSTVPPAPPVNVTITFDTGSTEMIGAGAVNWQPLSVPGFPGGASIAVLHGNPAGEGDYTIRLRFPDGYRVPVHWHPKAEHVTILSGTFDFAMSGDSMSATHPHAAGDFLYLPPRMPHHGRMRGETVLQLHGMGPFAINLGTP